MTFLKTAFVSSILSVGFTSAALSMPVTFTYESNALDTSVLQDWEQDFVQNALDAGYLYSLPARAELTIEIDCDITGAVWDCGDASLNNGAFSPTYDVYDAGNLTLTSQGTFTDSIYVRAFEVDASGEVVQWEFEGTEGYRSGLGDFHISHDGDFWGWSENLFGIDSSPYFYCKSTYGDTEAEFEWALVSGYESGTCANNAPALWMDPKITISGIGVWTAQPGITSVQEPQTSVTSMPLPAGLPLLLVGLGSLTWLSRRRA